MGLDQYAYVSNNGKHDDDSRDIFYWRKHNRLHGWMEQLYRTKGGNKEFNCADVELTLEDIELLESTILNKCYQRQEVSSLVMILIPITKVNMDIKMMILNLLKSLEMN